MKMDEIKSLTLVSEYNEKQNRVFFCLISSIAYANNVKLVCRHVRFSFYYDHKTFHYVLFNVRFLQNIDTAYLLIQKQSCLLR